MKGRTRSAVALCYDGHEFVVPIVSAVGKAELARMMRQVACRHGVPVVECEQLVSALESIQPGEPIPEASYRPVAGLFTELERRRSR